MEIRPYIPGEDMTDIDTYHYEESDIKEGGMIVRNPDKPHLEAWYVSNKFFVEEYIPVDSDG